MLQEHEEAYQTEVPLLFGGLFCMGFRNNSERPPLLTFASPVLSPSCGLFFLRPCHPHRLLLVRRGRVISRGHVRGDREIPRDISPSFSRNGGGHGGGYEVIVRYLAVIPRVTARYLTVTPGATAGYLAATSQIPLPGGVVHGLCKGGPGPWEDGWGDSDAIARHLTDTPTGDRDVSHGHPRGHLLLPADRVIPRGPYAAARIRWKMLVGEGGGV